jgi:hypothetical protein
MRWRAAKSQQAQQPQQAPRALRVRAGAIDGALLAGASAAYALVAWLRLPAQERRRLGLTALRLPGQGGRRALLLGAARDALGAAGEQYGSPGQRIVGLRTVDARTGGPVALRRRLALIAFARASEALRNRAMRANNATAEARRSELAGRVKALRAEHGEGTPELQEAMGRLFERHRAEGGAEPVVSNLLLLAVGVAIGLANRRLERALAPTVVVIRRP